MHHSHLDIGYTHPQPLLLELQCDYIDQAIDLCLKTAEYPEESKFRWTCEATYPVCRWLETATHERIDTLKKLIHAGQISIAALPMHTTPGCSTYDMVNMLKNLNLLRDKLDAKITTAINHDINGQPWTLSQVMLDSGIDFYLTGINIHFGGIPFERPAAFHWQTSDDRKLLTFLGEHYSLFSQFFFTSEGDTHLLHQGVTGYVDGLEKNGYQQDFAFLTATNPPLFDNNCPDSELADLIYRYNEEDHEQKIRFVTPEMLRDKLLEAGTCDLPVYCGDWTDYWNFGSASTAWETKVNRLAKKNIQKAEMLESISGSTGGHYDRVKEEALLNALIFDEHTWGASQSVTDPHGEETRSQLIHKVKTAYQAADLSAYLVSTQIEKLAGNPYQSEKPEGIIVVNTSGTRQEVELEVPLSYLKEGRNLSSLRSKEYLPYVDKREKTADYGTISMEPFSWRKIPFDVLNRYKAKKNEKKKAYSLAKNELITPYYRVKFNDETGRIIQIYSIDQKWDILDETSEWSFFELVRETIDTRYHKQERGTLFPRDVDKGNQNISVWNHEWKACRMGAGISDWHIDEREDSICFVWELEAKGMKNIIQSVTFSLSTSRISMDVKFMKEPICAPEAVYFAFPLRLDRNWECIYDTADEFVRLDKNQLGNVCRDWVTVDNSVSMFDERKGVTLACPDAPMIQAGGFNFGKESKEIKRGENPLLLAWTMNNYWDTNFMADQSGTMSFHYELSPFDDFDSREVYTNSIAAKKPYVIGAVTSCRDEERGILLKGEGEVVPIYVRPAKDQDDKKKAFIIGLKNMTDKEQRYTFAIPDFMNTGAHEITIQEEIKNPLTITDNVVSVNLPPHGFKQVRVINEI